MSELLRIKVEVAIKQLERAEKLLGGLENEGERWQMNYERL